MWLTMEDGSETLVGWLSKVTLFKGSGIATVTLDDDLVPYLFALGGQFTQYQLCNILSMKSAFSIRMYELLKSYGFQKSKIFQDYVKAFFFFYQKVYRYFFFSFLDFIC